MGFVDGNLEWNFYNLLDLTRSSCENYRPCDSGTALSPTELQRDSCCRTLTTSSYINTKVMPMYGVWVNTLKLGGDWHKYTLPDLLYT